MKIGRDHLWTAEAAERLGVSDIVVRRLFDTGKLDGFRIPGSGYRRITPESVERVRAEMRGGEGG